MKKLLFTFILALLATVSAWAQTFTAGNLKYEVTDAAAKTVKLTGYVTKPTGALTIPATVTNESTEYSVTSIGSSAFSSCTSLTEVNIPASVTNIGSSAFSSCYYLKAVTIPEGVTSIGSRAFSSCYYLTAVTIPASVTNIGSSAFSWCSRLTAVTIPEGVATIGDYAFERCSALTELTVLATTPPTLGTDVFLNVSRTIPVYVPAASLAAYKTAEVWKEFTNLQAIPSGLDTPSMPESIRIYGGMLHNPEGLRVTLYDLAGRIAYDGRAAIVELPAGVYVVRCNGATGKAVF